ncbi:MAG: MFS transporter, partial [Chthoniobacterales bacterium]
EQYGQVNAAFQGAYAAGLIAFGWFVDRFGTKIGYSVSIVAWSAAAAAHALVGTVSGFLTARIALGLGEGGNFPSAIKATAQWFPKRERAFATALFNSGANVGAIVAPAIVPVIAIKFGWHAAFLLAGILGLVWLVAWQMFYDIPERHKSVKASELALIEGDAADPADTGGKVPWLHLLGYRQAWSFIAAKFLTDPIWWFFLLWLPDYLSTRGVKFDKLGAPLMTIYVIVTVLSIIGSYLVGFFMARGWSVTKARKLGMLVFAICVLPTFIVPHVSLWTAVALFGLAGAAHQAWSANLFTTVSDMFPKRAVASLIGIGGMAGSIGGMLFPIWCGKVLDHYKASGNVVEGYSHILPICAFAYLVALGVNTLLAPKFDQVRLKLPEA